ncbi:hypothetical protein [Planococcus sp. SSTMD024]|uniref:hypothetical protein n=1 Tax=Planococcus sp. SSTMD024 TaxID=3242163 RepID=UPI00351DEB69
MIVAIKKKAKYIEKNSKVKINIGIKALEYCNLVSLKQLVPKKISLQQLAGQEVLSELPVEVMEDDKAYVPQKN